MTTDATDRPRRADAGRRPRRRPPRPAGHGARASPGAGSPSPGSSPTRAPTSRSTTAGRPPSWPTRSRALEGRAVRLLAGPDVDPASAWAGAALVATSPSINPDYPTTEPRLRAALRGARRRTARRRPRAPALVSEAGPVPPPLPGADDRRDRHEGQDDDVVADRGGPRRGPDPPGRARRQHRDPARRAAAGADAGAPRRHRAVASSSCRRCRAGTTVAVYTNVTSDHLDRHGSLEGYRAAKRRLAELVDPAGALVLNADDPVVAAYAELEHGAGHVLRLGRAARRRRRRRRRLDRRTTARARTSCPSTSSRSPAAHNVSNALAAVAIGLLFGIAAGRDPRAPPPRSPASSTASSRSPTSTASASSTTRRAPSRTRSSPRSSAFDAADRADRRRPRQGRRPVGPRARSSRSAPPPPS